jgi:hypothetical protein
VPHSQVLVLRPQGPSPLPPIVGITHSEYTRGHRGRHTLGYTGIPGPRRTESAVCDRVAGVGGCR